MNTSAGVDESSRRPSRIPYVAGGALLGGVIAGVSTYNDIRHSDAILGEVSVAIATLGGVVVGGLLGWAVYEIRY
jgi:hypothetical protein